MTALSLDNVSLSYPIYEITGRSLKRSLLNVTTGGLISTNHHHVVINALRTVSVRLETGDRLGLVGHNGAGKSSLLKVMSGVYEPQQGTVNIEGQVSALLNVDLGMNPESTGYENIKTRALILGYRKTRIQKMIDEVAEFTEMGNFLAMPVKTYSAGMRLRLAFAVSTAVNPEILLIDEIIGAGDESFMEKAYVRLEQLIAQSNILVLSTHNSMLIQKFCNKVLWLEQGSIRALGDTATVLNEYRGLEQTTY